MAISLSLSLGMLSVSMIMLVLIRNNLVEANERAEAMFVYERERDAAPPHLVDVRVMTPVQIADLPLPVLTDALSPKEPCKKARVK